MLAHKILSTKYSSLAVVQFLSAANIPNGTSDLNRSLTLNSGFAPMDMLVAMTANRNAEAPPLLAGYTNILSRSGTTRSFRLQYKLAASSSETIAWNGAYGYLLALRNASRVGVTGVVSTGSSSTVTIASLFGLDTSGAGFILAGSYIVQLYTSVTSPYTLLQANSVNIAAFVEKNKNLNIVNETITASALFGGSYAIEFLP